MELKIKQRPKHFNNYGDRAFENAAPKLWNKLPVQIRTSNTLSSLKKQLKTHLFTSYYN